MECRSGGHAHALCVGDDQRSAAVERELTWGLTQPPTWGYMFHFTAPKTDTCANTRIYQRTRE